MPRPASHNENIFRRITLRTYTPISHAYILRLFNNNDENGTIYTMSVTMLQHALSPYEGESDSNTIHCSPQSYKSTVLHGTTCYHASPCLPIAPFNSLDQYETLSTLIQFFTESRKTPEIDQPFVPEFKLDMQAVPRFPVRLLDFFLHAAVKSVIEREKQNGLTQSQIVQHWLKTHTHEFSGNQAASTKLWDAVLVGLDVEWYEWDKNSITELGISILDPRKLLNKDTNNSVSAWIALREMVNHHVRIRPNAHLVNGEKCLGYPDNFQFGKTSFVSAAEAKQLLTKAFTHLDSAGNKRPVIFCGHAVDNDAQMMKEKFDFDIDGLQVVIATIDSQAIAIEAGLFDAVRLPNLKNLLAKYEISEPYLHNAGNDIVCSIMAALIVPSEKPPYAAQFQYNTMKTFLRMQNSPPALQPAGTPLFCIRCDAEGHTAVGCNAKIQACAHCSNDPSRVAKAATHKTDRCFDFVRLPGQARERAELAALLPIACEHCDMSPLPSRNNRKAAHSHKAADCPYFPGNAGK
jgi:hypothetical protein